jgi:recombination DNA repair RAD52 pathway protein
MLDKPNIEKGRSLMPGFDEQQLSLLRAPLSRDHVKTRTQAGRTLSYLEGWVAIAEANRIFGFDGWDRETIECRCVSEKPCIIGAGGQYEKPGFRVSYVGKVRVTVRAGECVIVREGTGYGSGIDADIGEAHESAAKECETDALKRSLMTFGNPFGLALYDKTQAEVEPVASRPRTPEAAAHPTERERKVLAAREARKRITEALGVARTPAIIDEVIERATKDLALIKEVHEPSLDAIMALSARLKGELYGATG